MRKHRTADGNLAVRLMDHLIVPTFVLDADGRVLVWNKACERLTGLRAADVLGTSDHWRAFYTAPRPCLADHVLSGWGAEAGDLDEEQVQAAAGRTNLSAENWCEMPQLGSRRYLEVDAGPIFDDSGQMIAAVETLRDMTVQREAQLTLKTLASLDGLTGLANRRRFNEAFENEWRRAARDRLGLALLMIDVDHFKAFNDLAGHPAGDECLRQIARAISSQVLRPGDQAARYGGEEFAVILPNTPLNGALAVADRIMCAVEHMRLQRPDTGIVTVSIGVAARTPVPEDGPETLLVDADRALYRAKRKGRARVVGAGMEVASSARAAA